MQGFFDIPAESVPGAQTARSLHESLIELLPDAVLALDVQAGLFVLANAAAERLLSTPRGQLSKLGLRDLVRPWDVAQLARVEAALASDGQWRGELWLRRGDGTFVPTDVAVQAWNLEGRLLAQFCCRDMSDHWRDDALRQVVGHAAERLAATLDDADVLRTTVTAALPGLADAALVELDAIDDAEPVAVAAYSDPLSPNWPAATVDERPRPHIRTALRRGSALELPLMVHGRQFGTLTLQRTGHRTWETRDRPLAEELARHAAHAIDQARRWSQARRELNDRAAALRIVSAIDAGVTPRGVFELLIEEAQAAIGADDGGAARYDADRSRLVPGLPRTAKQALCTVDPHLMVSVAASERCALIENDYQRSMGKRTPAGRAGAQAVLAVPLVHRGALLGSISLSQIASTRRFQPIDGRRLEMLASAAALTLSGMARQQAAGARLARPDLPHSINVDLATPFGAQDMPDTPGCRLALGPLVDSALDGLRQVDEHVTLLRRLPSSYC